MSALEKQRRTRSRGLTLIELLTVMIILAVLLTVAVGGFGGMFSRKRTEGVAADLGTDFEYARGEAVARNAVVRVTLGTNCYAVHTAGTTAGSCVRSPPSADAGTGGVVIKSFALDASSNATITAQPNGLSYVEFDPVRGTATGRNAAGGALNDPGVLVGSAAGPWQLRIRPRLSGRVETCSPASTMPGYRPCVD